MLENKYGITVNDEPSNKDIASNNKVLRKSADNEYTDFIKRMKKEGYKDVKEADIFLQFKDDKHNVFFSSGAMINDFDEIIYYGAWVDLNKEDVIKYEAGNFVDGQMEKAISSSGGSGISINSVVTDWGTFTCGLIGVLTCAKHCAVWSLAFPTAALAIGGTCSVVCGTLFLIACN